MTITEKSQFIDFKISKLNKKKETFKSKICQVDNEIKSLREEKKQLREEKKSK